MDPPSETPESLGLLSILCTDVFIPETRRVIGWQHRKQRASCAPRRAPPLNWGVAKTGRCLPKRSRGRLSDTLLAEGALVASCPPTESHTRYISRPHSLWGFPPGPGSPTQALYQIQGWVLTHKPFIELKGACRLTLVFLVQYLILFIFLVTGRVCVLFCFFFFFFFWLRAKQLVYIVR